MLDHKRYSAQCLEDGTIVVKEEPEGKEKFRLCLFGQEFRRPLHMQQDAMLPTPYITADDRLLIVGFGMGYLFFINLADGAVIKYMKLFPEVTYEDASYGEIDVQGYYSFETRLDLSGDGRYAVIRVRGEYDPQSGDGEFSPVYVRSFFLMDMGSLEIVFSDDYGDIPDNGYLNLGVAVFSPDSRFLAVASLGGVLKLFDLEEKREVYRYEAIEWIPYSGAIQHRNLAVFTENRTFVLINKEKCLVKVRMGPDGSWREEQVTEVASFMPSEREFTVFDIGYDAERREIVCHCALDKGKSKSFSVPFAIISKKP